MGDMNPESVLEPDARLSHC